MTVSVYSVVSGKGGVGKTIISANLGLALGEREKQVLLVDADLPSGNLAHYLGMKNLTPNLLDFLAGDVDSIDEILRDVSENVDILPTTNSLRKFLSADISKLESILTDLGEYYDFIIIDSPPGISRNSISPIEISDELLLVVTPDEASVSAAENIHKIGKILEREVRGFIVNKWRERGFFDRLFGDDSQMNIEKIEDRMIIENLGKIPYDDSVRESTERGEPLLEYDKSSKAFEAIEKISEEIAG